MARWSYDAERDVDVLVPEPMTHRPSEKLAGAAPIEGRWLGHSLDSIVDVTPAPAPTRWQRFWRWLV